MSPGGFADFLRANPRLGEKLRAIAAPPARRGRLGFISDAVTLLFLVPLLRVVLVEFGLPWRLSGGLFETRHWQRLRQWVETEYEVRGAPSAKALVVAGTLMRELEATADEELRHQWEALAEAMSRRDQADDASQHH